MQKFVNLIDDVAEKVAMTREEIAPFQEDFVVQLKETLDGVEDLTDEDLISVGAAVLEDVLLSKESATEETNNDNDNEQVEVIEPEEVVPDARTMFELRTEVEEVLNGNPMTIARLAGTLEVTTKAVGEIVTDLIDLGLITKVKKTLHWVTEETTEETEDEPDYTDLVSDEPEVVESDVPHLEEPAEAPAETTNHAAEHAIEVAFATAKLDVLKVLDQQRKASESNPAYKAQAEQYTEVMESLRGLLDEIQNSEQYKLHDPLWQRVARIAEWQPEA